MYTWVFKIFEHVSFGSLKVTYVLKIFGYKIKSSSTKLQTTARERHIVSERGVHASRVSVGYYNIPRWICRGIL
jgi:hypothetical protein